MRKENRLTNLEQNILVRLDWKKEATAIELSRWFEIDKSEVYRMLKKLKKCGYIDCNDLKPATYFSLRQIEN